MTRKELRQLIECAERQEKVLRKKRNIREKCPIRSGHLPGGGRRRQRGHCITANPF